MANGQTSTEKRLLWISGAVAIAAGFFTALNQFFEQFRTFVGIFAELRGWQILAPAAGFTLIGLWLFVLARRRRSILTRPDALRLNRGNPEHLIGRADTIDLLSQKCRAEPLMFLVGESGAGKSALVQAGMVPFFRQASDGGLLPVYIDSLVGSDWEEGPRRALVRSLRAAAVDLPEQAAAVRTVAELADFDARFGRTPLLIFDQFDDYQTRYREQFLRSQIWIEPPQLVAGNAFWRDIASLLEAGQVHVLIVTRSDSAAGLASVRFARALTFNLDPLAKHYVGPILDRLVGDETARVIVDPDYGWNRLRARLVADLERGGSVLPQRLKVVLLGLSALPKGIVTVTAYERAGCAAGLEARFIEDRIAAASALFHIPEERLRRALMLMVDAGGPKTLEVPQEKIAEALGRAGEDLNSILERLEDDEILRRRARTADSAPNWQLDHDYLAGAVIKADYNANRWQRTLAQGAETLAQAEGSLARRWRALLPPMVQLKMAADRLRGRFHYGVFRGYAATSLQRFAPAAALLLAVAAAGAYQAEEMRKDRMREQSGPILNAFNDDSELSEAEGLALVRLARAPEALQLHVLESFLARDRATNFLYPAPAILKAIVGASPDRRGRVVEFLAERSRAKSFQAMETRRALAVATDWLGRPGALGVDWWLHSIESDAEGRHVYVGGIGSLLATHPLKTEEVQGIVDTCVKLLRNPGVPVEAELGRGLIPLLDMLTKLPPGAAPGADRAGEFARALIHAVETTGAAEAEPRRERDLVSAVAEEVAQLPPHFRFPQEEAARIRAHAEQLLSGPEAEAFELVSFIRLINAPVMGAVQTGSEKASAAAVATDLATRGEPPPGSFGIFENLPAGISFSSDQRSKIVAAVSRQLARSLSTENADDDIPGTEDLAAVDRSLGLNEAERAVMIAPVKQAVLASLARPNGVAAALSTEGRLPGSLSIAGHSDVRPRIASAFLAQLEATKGDEAALDRLTGLLQGESYRLPLSPPEADRAFALLMDAVERGSWAAQEPIRALLVQYPDRPAWIDRLAQVIRSAHRAGLDRFDDDRSVYRILDSDISFPTDIVAIMRLEGCRRLTPGPGRGGFEPTLMLVHEIGAGRRVRIAQALAMFADPLVVPWTESGIVRHLQKLAGAGLDFGEDRWKAIAWAETIGLDEQLDQRFDPSACYEGYPPGWRAELRLAGFGRD